MGLYDKLLRFLATADLVGVVKAATTKGRVILVHRGCGMSGRDIERLLKHNKVKVKDVFVITQQDLLRFVVDDYDKAVGILNKKGIKRV